MSSENRNERVIVVSQRRENDFSEQVQEASPLEVQLVTPTDDVLNDIDSEPLDGIIIELESPERTRALLERIREQTLTLPVIVAPTDGSEALATVALRAGATDYVSPSIDGDRVERISNGFRSSMDSTTVDLSEQLELQQLLANTLPDETFVIDETGTYLEAKHRPESGELYSLPVNALVGQTLSSAFPEPLATELQGCVDRTLETEQIQTIEYEAETTEGTRWFEARVVPIDEPVGGSRAVVWLARDVTERVARERSLRQRRDHLETLDRINAVVGRVIQTLVEAPTRTAIETEVCEQIVDSELYCGSWIGEPSGKGRVCFRTGAGEAETFLEGVKEVSNDEDRPVVDALETGEMQFTNRLLDEPEMPEHLQRAARRYSIRSAIAVPITHDETVYGVLAVLANRGDAFSEREKSAFRVLGETIGFAISAVKNKRLLFADAVSELEFRIDGDSFSFDISEIPECSASVEWAGTTAQGETYQYITIDGLDGQNALEKADAHPSVAECRLIHDSNQQCTIEIRLYESGVRTLANHGATIKNITFEDGIGQGIFEVPRDANVREIVETLQQVYEDTELIARRDVDRPVQTAAERRERLLGQLTERQLTTLRLAYYGGFFDWPRESTGEEIAEAMDVSPPTMHQHLRKGLSELLTEFFEEGGGTASSRQHTRE